MKFIDRNTGEVFDKWNFEKCKDLALEAEVEKSKIFSLTIED